MCSFLAWLLNNLSELHTSNATFNLEYSNAPDSLILAKVSKMKVDVRLRASGFQLLNFSFKPKKIKIDLASVANKGNDYYIDSQTYKKQIDRQLSNSIEILDIDKDTVHFTFYESYSKEILVHPNINMTLAQNYIQEGALKIEPSHVTITGPKHEVDEVKRIHTNEINFKNLSSDFLKETQIIVPEALEFTSFSSDVVTVSGEIVRFSEKIINVPIKVLNVPTGMHIVTYPSVVPVLCKAKLEELKNIEPSDFLISVDYNTTAKSSTNVLVLQLSKLPENVYNAQLMETEVDYILKKE